MVLIQDQEFMTQALELADAAASLGEVPVGAVVVFEGRVIAKAHNRRMLDNDPTAHAELLAMRAAAKVIGDWRLERCNLGALPYVCRCDGSWQSGKMCLWLRRSEGWLFRYSS